MLSVPSSSNIGTRFDLKIAWGTDFKARALSFLNPDGSAVDMTNMTIAGAIRKSANTPPIASFVIGITNPTVAPQAQMSLPYAQVILLPFSQFDLDQTGKCVWDLKVTDSLGNVSRPLYGDVWVWFEVTP